MTDAANAFAPVTFCIEAAMQTGQNGIVPITVVPRAIAWLDRYQMFFDGTGPAFATAITPGGLRPVETRIRGCYSPTRPNDGGEMHLDFTVL